MIVTHRNSAVTSPFDLHAGSAYRQWRERKLDAVQLPPQVVELRDPARLGTAGRARLLDEVRRHGFAVYSTAAPVDADGISRFAAALGLRSPDLDGQADPGNGVSTLHADASTARGAFIPYTDRPLNWHTDGYYYPPHKRIRTFILHCLQPAAEGGVNQLFDHELVYLRLRDRQPAWIEALSRPDAFTIPAHRVDGVVHRAAVSGPVFSATGDGRVHMRYTARERSIAWASDARLDEARSALRELLDSGDPFKRRVTPSSGQGIVCANLLHDRSGFTDRGDQVRRLLRARYHDALEEASAT